MGALYIFLCHGRCPLYGQEYCLILALKMLGTHRHQSADCLPFLLLGFLASFTFIFFIPTSLSKHPSSLPTCLHYHLFPESRVRGGSHPQKAMSYRDFSVLTFPYPGSLQATFSLKCILPLTFHPISTSWHSLFFWLLQVLPALTLSDEISPWQGREVVKCCLKQRTGDSVLREKLGKLASVLGIDWPPGLSN